MISGKWVRALGICLALAGSGAFASDETGLHDLMTALARRGSSQVAFEETKSLKVLNSSIQLHGTMSYKAPDTVVREVAGPSPERFEIHGSSFTIEKNGKRQTVRVDALPVARAFIEAFRATLSGDEAVLRQYYEVDFSGSFEAWTLRLVPRQEALRNKVREFIWSGHEAQVSRIVIQEQNGDSTRIDLAPIPGTMHGRAH